MSDEEEMDALRANTPAHEELLSSSAKTLVGGTLELASMALQASVEKIAGADPLSAERYVHLAEKLSLIATRFYDLGEATRLRNLEYWEDLKDETS